MVVVHLDRAAESRRGPPNRKPFRAPLLPTPSQSVNHMPHLGLLTPLDPVCWHHHVRTMLQRMYTTLKMKH